MKNDIDFDALDKAVNSLMTSNAASVGARDDTPTQKTLSINTTLKPDEDPSYNKLGEVAKKIGNETLIADGERTVLQDLDTNPPKVVALDTPDSPVTMAPVEPQPTPPELPTAPAAPTPQAPKGRFMDVVHPSSDMRTTTKAADPALVAPEVPEVPALEVSTPSEAEPPVEQAAKEPATKPEPLTPFLPDAKVEKRPLGTSNAAPLVGAVPSPFGSVESEPVVPPTPETPSGEDEQARTLQSVEAVEVAPSTPESATSSGSIQQVESVEAEKTATGDGAIYDTKEYHQPLTHTAKKKSGWGVVLIIILIIALAAALGAAAYFILGVGV